MFSNLRFLWELCLSLCFSRIVPDSFMFSSTGMMMDLGHFLGVLNNPFFGGAACDLSRAVQFPIITFYSFILDLGFTCLCCIFRFLFPALSSGGNEAQKNFTAWPTTYMFLTELELTSIYKGYHFLIIQIHLVTTEFCFFF